MSTSRLLHLRSLASSSSSLHVARTSSLISRTPLRAMSRMMSTAPPSSSSSSSSSSTPRRLNIIETPLAPGESAPVSSWTANRQKVDPSQFPARTKPRWQNPRGVEQVEMPAQYPFLRSLGKAAHVTAVLSLIGLTVYTSYCVGYNYYTIRQRRIEWERDHPEELARLVAELKAKKDAAAAEAAAKYGNFAPNPTGSAEPTTTK